jgi:hypothetical protein
MSGKLVYLILAHQNCEQVKRLIVRLSDEMTLFVVHVDLKVSVNEFKKLENIDNTFLITNRSLCNWGDYSIVNTTLNGLRYIKENIKIYDRVILLSGQDYPIKSTAYIKNYFESDTDRIYIEYFSLPFSGLTNGGIHRFPNFYEIQQNLPLYAGSQWWSLPFSVVNYLLDVVHESKFYKEYFEKVFAPDESFFQTLLLNSKEDFILGNLSRYSLHYLDWTTGEKSPKILTIDDFKELASSSKLFARKFNMNTHDEILTLIDHELLR